MQLASVSRAVTLLAHSTPLPSPRPSFIQSVRPKLGTGLLMRHVGCGVGELCTTGVGCCGCADATALPSRVVGRQHGTSHAGDRICQNNSFGRLVALPRTDPDYPRAVVLLQDHPSQNLLMFIAFQPRVCIRENRAPTLNVMSDHFPYSVRRQ